MARKSDKKNIRLQDLAEKLNTSASTISRALNDHPLISEETKKKVLDAAMELGYQPAIPNLLTDSEVNTVVLVLPNIREESYQQIWSSVNKFYHDKKHIVLCAETKGDPQFEKEYFMQLDKMNINGIIYIAHQNSQESLKYIVNRSFPVVVVHNDDLISNASHIVLDYYQSLTKAILHLKENGANSLSFIANNIESHLINQIKDALPVVSKENDILFVDDAILTSDMDIESFSNLLNEKFFLNDSLLPDALIFGSQELAIRFQNLIRMNKKESPLIMSLGKDRFSYLAKPKISYIELNSEKMGEEAALLLDSQIQQKENPNTRVVVSGLVIKGSTLKF